MDSADANAARLILAVLDDPAWKDELPKMVVGSLARQRRGAWLTTTANLWGSLALDKFAAKFESQKVAGATVADDRVAGAERRGVIGARRRLGHAGGGRQGQPAPGRRAAGTLIVAQQRQRQALAHGAKPRRDPAQGAAVGRLQHRPQRQRGRAEGQVALVARRRRRGCGSRSTPRADMTWVVVSDPVPGGATILGSGLGRDSAIATRSEKRAGSAWPAFEERSFEAFRSYYEYLPRGKHVVEYSVRLQQPGQVRAAADAGRGDVRAGELRRAAERGDRGRP